MKETSITNADFVALIAIFIAIVSGTLNVSLMRENNRLSTLANEQGIKIDAMERTLLMNR
jgi:hypothetical protein